MVPDDTITVNSTIKVQPIEVCAITVIIPPTSSTVTSTVITNPLVIVSVMSSELHASIDVRQSFAAFLTKTYNTIYIHQLRNRGCYCNNTICFTCVCVLLMQPNPDQIQLELIDERTLNLSTAVPTIVVVNTVATEIHQH